LAPRTQVLHGAVENKELDQQQPNPMRTHRGSTGTPRSSGFTLVEVMTVLALLGILTAIAVPSY
jgi:prepilin-type N-terminal cleavage/methylation domain-containing protein